MSKGKKLLEKARRGAALRFDELVQLALLFGFVQVRVRGSHHIFKHADVDELLNLQDVNGEAKDYQVRQVLKLIESYGLAMDAGGVSE